MSINNGKCLNKRKLKKKESLLRFLALTVPENQHTQKQFVHGLMGKELKP